MCAKQLRSELVELLAAESVLDFFCHCGESTIHIQAVCTKGRLLAAVLVCPLTVSWLKPPDSHRSIMVHPSGRGHARQLSPSLQIKSVSYPSWASCLQGGFACTRRPLWGNHCLPTAWTLCLPPSLCVCLCVCIQTNRIRRGPIPHGTFPSGFICFLTKLGDFDIYISRC